MSCFFSPSRAVLSVILRDECLTSAVRTNGQMMYRSPERSPQDSRDGIFCIVPRPHFFGRALIWPGCFGEHILGRVCQSLWDSFLYLGKLHWFLYLLLSYFYDPGMSIFRWSSNFVEKVVLNESMSAKMASRVFYLVY